MRFNNDFGVFWVDNVVLVVTECPTMWKKNSLLCQLFRREISLNGHIKMWKSCFKFLHRQQPLYHYGPEDLGPYFGSTVFEILKTLIFRKKNTIFFKKYNYELKHQVTCHI